MVEKPERLSRGVRISEAAALIDAHSQIRDFATAMEEAARLRVELAADQHLDFLLIGALTTSCITRYCRPFTTGSRNREEVQASLHRLDSKKRASHDRLVDWRNKHIAHSVNGFESNYLFAEWDEEPLTPKTIRSVDVAESRVVGLQQQDIRAIGELTQYFINELRIYIDRETVRILEIARNAPQSAIHLTGGIGHIFPEHSRIDKTRPRK